MDDNLIKNFFLNSISLIDYTFDEKCGSLVALSEFMDQVDNKLIMDYDGFGDVIYKGEEIENAIPYVNLQLIGLSDSVFFPLDKLYRIFGNDIKIDWHNK